MIVSGKFRFHVAESKMTSLNPLPPDDTTFCCSSIFLSWSRGQAQPQLRQPLSGSHHCLHPGVQCELSPGGTQKIFCEPPSEGYAQLSDTDVGRTIKPPFAYVAECPGKTTDVAKRSPNLPQCSLGGHGSHGRPPAFRPSHERMMTPMLRRSLLGTAPKKRAFNSSTTAAPTVGGGGGDGGNGGGGGGRGGGGSGGGWAWEACLGLAVVAALAPVQEESVVAEEVWGRRSAAYQLSLPSEMLSA